MSQVIDHLRRRIEEADRDYQATIRKRLDVLKLEQTLQKELEGYRTALEGEMRRAGIVVPDAGERASAQQPISANGHKRGSANATILGYIGEAGKAGITRQEIFSRLASEGIKVHKNYPYVVISKLKEDELIEERDGKVILK